MHTESGNPSSPLLVGVDLGSTTVKAIVCEPDGTTVARAIVPTATHYPRPSWAFYRPDELWNQVVQVLREATARVDDPRRIAGIAVASCGEAGVSLDRDDEPTYDAIAWFDRRTIRQMEWLSSEIGEDRLHGITGLSVQPIFTLCKLLWLKEEEPAAFARTVRFLMLADYVAFKLGGKAATNLSLASRTLALDLRALDWSTEILDATGIPRTIFPGTVPSGARVGAVTAETARLTGLPEGAAVGAGGHDHVCAALAAGVVEPGAVFDSIGTAEAIFVALDQPLLDPTASQEGYTQGVHVVPGRYYVLGGLYTSGVCVDWFRDVVGRDVPLRALLAEAEAAPIGSLGTVFLPHLRLANAPHPDGRARGAFIGLSTDATRGALMRAVVEGLAFEARSTVAPMLRHAEINRLTDVTVSGGGTRNDLLLRIKASVWNARLHVTNLEETTALGAAILGGLAAGVYIDVNDALGQIRANPTIVEPDPYAVPIYEALFRDVYQPLYDALRDLNHRLHDLLIAPAATADG